VLPLHEFVAEPITDPIAANPIAAESATEHLHSITDSAGAGAALTETFYLCVQV
jgi:hypothetical protein